MLEVDNLITRIRDSEEKVSGGIQAPHTFAPHPQLSSIQVGIRFLLTVTGFSIQI